MYINAKPGFWLDNRGFGEQQVENHFFKVKVLQNVVGPSLPPALLFSCIQPHQQLLELRGKLELLERES